MQKQKTSLWKRLLAVALGTTLMLSVVAAIGPAKVQAATKTMDFSASFQNQGEHLKFNVPANVGDEVTLNLSISNQTGTDLSFTEHFGVTGQTNQQYHPLATGETWNVSLTATRDASINTHTGFIFNNAAHIVQFLWADEASSGGDNDDNDEPEGPSAEERAEQARQERLEQEYRELVEEATAPANQTVAGMKSQQDGYYLAKKVEGVCFVPDAATAAPAGNSFVKVTDTDKNKSKGAMNSANAVATMLGGTVGPCIDVRYGRMEKGSYVLSPIASGGTMSIGIPQAFRTLGANYAVVAIYAGGAYKVFENTSADPAYVTVTVEEALSADVMYAIIKL